MKTIVFLIVAIILLSFSSCAPLETLSSHDFASGYYKIKTKGAEKAEKIYADVTSDTVKIHAIDLSSGKKKPNQVPDRLISVSEASSWGQFAGTRLTRTSVDADLSTILTKLRPAQANVPMQLNANLNALVYIGLRKDYFTLKSHTDPLKRVKSYIRHAGYDIGLFAGLGITQVTPTNTNFKTLKEYDGVVFQKGIAAFFTIENISLGLSLGFDNLLNGNSDIWIYNQKPYIGLVIGIANF